MKRWKHTSMGKIVQMYGKQARNFASIHPTKNGMYFYRVKQLQAWAAYWDDMHHDDAIITKSPNLIGCNTTFTSTGDAYLYVESLLAHILDGDGCLELIENHNKLIIVKCHDVGYGYVVHHCMNFGDGWINQGSLWRFDKMFEMLDVLLGTMYDSHWGGIPSKFLKSMQDA